MAAQPGWQELSNTNLTSVCPPDNSGGITYAFTYFCTNEVNAWSGALADTKRSRLILWGGGHSDYEGNEVYALSLTQNPPTLTRLTNPSAWDYSISYEANADGTPTARHTYNDVVYLPAQDALFSFSGGLPAGIGTNHTWLFTFADNQWHAMDPVNGFDPLGPTVTLSVTGAACVYDPNSENVFCLNGDTSALFQYTPATNTYARLSTNTPYPLAATPALDPDRKLMVLMGNAGDGVTFHVSVIDISGDDPTYAVQDWTSEVTGCAGMSANWPGFSYDSALKMFVGYPNTGNTVYLFDAGTKTCTTQSFPNGPQVSGTPRGTFGRFQYFPALDSFVALLDPTKDAFSLQLSSGATGPSSGSTPPSPDPRPVDPVSGPTMVTGCSCRAGNTEDACGPPILVPVLLGASLWMRRGKRNLPTLGRRVG